MTIDKLLIPINEEKSLHATYYHGNKAELLPPIVILCHGFSGDQTEWGRFTYSAEKILENGFDAILFDFSGSGKNSRELITLSKQINDLEKIYAWVKNQGYTKINTIGLSFGGITSLLANLPNRITAIFWAPAFYFNRMIKPMEKVGLNLMKLFSKKPIKMESINNEPIIIDNSFANDKKNKETDLGIRNLKSPVLLIQGANDTRINPKNLEEAMSKWPSDEHHKKIIVPCADHDFKDKQLDEYIAHTIQWLKKYN